MRPDRAAISAVRLGRAPVVRLLAVVLVVAGFVFQGVIPGLDMALRGEGLPFAQVMRTGICHSPPAAAAERTAVPARDDGNGGGQSESHGCCLVCQAASSAKGALPSPTFIVPTAGTAELRIVETAQALVHGQASHHHCARAPPPVAA